MCIWNVYLGKVDRAFSKVHIVQSREFFKNFVNSYKICSAIYYVNRLWKIKTIDSLSIHIFLYNF